MSEKELKAGQYVSFYLLWILSSILSVLDWWVLRAAISAVAVAIASAIPVEVQIERQWYARWPAAAVDKFAMAILGIVAVLSIIALDQIYRTALVEGTIRKRFGTVTAIQVGILIVSGAIILLTSRLL